MFTIQTATEKFEITSIIDLDSVPTGDLVVTYNDLAGKSIKKFETRSKGIERVWDLIKDTAATPVAVAKKRPAGRKDSLDGLATITIRCTENPKRVNSQAYSYWEKYKNGMTIEKLLTVVPMNDIRWNLEKHYISLEPSK